jgi:hypothetical protein
VEEGPIRTVLVRPENGARETYAVAQGTVLLAVVSIVVASALKGPPETAQDLAPYQRLFREQPASLQRTYRDVLSGLEDALRLRTPKGEWPSVQVLREELIPPFVGADPDYRWELRQKAAVLNYLGLPAPGTNKPVFLLLIQQGIPHPGTAALDEFHRKCPDGSLIHVGVWIHPRPEVERGVIFVPEREGWTEIVTGLAGPEAK